MRFTQGKLIIIILVSLASLNLSALSTGQKDARVHYKNIFTIMHGPVIGQVIILFHLSSVCRGDSVKSEEIFQIELARIKSIGGPRGPFSL